MIQKLFKNKIKKPFFIICDNVSIVSHSLRSRGDKIINFFCLLFGNTFPRIEIINYQFKLLFFSMLSVSPEKKPNGKESLVEALAKIFKQLWDFICIWSWSQWVFSLGGLVSVYITAGWIYNKYFTKKGGKLNTENIGYLMLCDLAINLCVGIWCMGLPYRNWPIGQFMLACPIAISPFIFVIELSMVYFASRYFYNMGYPRNSAKLNEWFGSPWANSLLFIVFAAPCHAVYRFFKKYYRLLLIWKPHKKK